MKDTRTVELKCEELSVQVELLTKEKETAHKEIKRLKDQVQFYYYYYHYLKKKHNDFCEFLSYQFLKATITHLYIFLLSFRY